MNPASVHIIGQGRCCLLKHRDYIYVGDPIPELNEQQHAAFLNHLQKAILCSLHQRGLIHSSQKERCLAEIEKRYTQTKNQHQA